MYVALDIGGSSLKTAVLTQDAKIIEKNSFGVPETYPEFYNLIESYILKQKHEIKGVCISSPGIVDTETGEIGGVTAIHYIHTNNLAKDISEKLSFDVSIENDANCAALGEITFGENKYNDMAFVIIGTGIGGAVIKDKKLHKGHNLIGGEIGYMIMNKDDHYQNLSYLGAIGSALKKTRLLTNEDIDGETLFKRAKEKKQPYYDIINDMFEWLAVGVYNLQYIYNPEAVIFGGNISQREDFIFYVEEGIKRFRNNYKLEITLPLLKKCTFYNDTNLYGALANFLLGNIIKAKS